MALLVWGGTQRSGVARGRRRRRRARARAITRLRSSLAPRRTHKHTQTPKRSVAHHLDVDTNDTTSTETKPTPKREPEGADEEERAREERRESLSFPRARAHRLPRRSLPARAHTMVVLAASVVTKTGKGKAQKTSHRPKTQGQQPPVVFSLARARLTPPLSPPSPQPHPQPLPTHSARVAAICRHEPHPDRRLARCVPQAGRGRQAAHLRRDGQRALRLPADGGAYMADA